jgi:RHS repeat-associated protein
MRRLRLLVAVFAGAAVALLMSTPAAAEISKFRTVQDTSGAPARYRVELRVGDDPEIVSDLLAATYSVRIEPFAEQGFHGFAIMALPARARLMSADPRVVAISDLDPSPPPRTERAQPDIAVEAPAESPRKKMASEAVPGFGTYTYDKSGNITSAGSHNFRYDAFGRLLDADLGAFGTQAYTYDRYGNIRSIVTNGNDSAIMAVDPTTNQIDLPYNAVSNPANVIGSYDLAGNLVEHQGKQYTYDALNMMKEAIDTPRRLYVYTASDERVVVITIDSGGETTEWTLRDTSDRMLRRLTKDASGVWHWKEDYIYGGGRLLAAEVPGPERVRHFHLDHLGTPRLITGNGGVRLAEKTYDAFGRKVSPPVADHFEQLEFTGHERDVPTLDYMHARYYQPYLGRFLSVDPGDDVDLSEPQSWNKYSYVRNNPINATDPDGRNIALAIRILRFVAPTVARHALLMGLRAAGPTVVRASTDYVQQRTSSYAHPVVVPTQLAEGIYEFPDAKTPDKTYVGQSEDTDRRLSEHEATGKKGSDTDATVTEVPGGKTAREHAEQNRINELGGKASAPGSQTSNKVNPIGPKRKKEVEDVYGPIKPPTMEPPR